MSGARLHNAAINALVERGDLVEVTSRERGRVYQASKIIAAVYEPSAPDADHP
jgi:hypothetical protein